MLELPEDIVEHIISFAFDRRGYNSIEYYKRKKKSYEKIMRINNEIKYYKSLDVSVCWLRGSNNQNFNLTEFKNSLKKGNPKITYHIGCYKDWHHELSRTGALSRRNSTQLTQLNLQQFFQQKMIENEF